MHTVITESVDETIHLGQSIGRSCSVGDIICLYGELGSGKTQLVKGIAEGLNIPADQISSPTYTLIAEHHNGALPIYHMDAYRIECQSELGPIGFDDYLARADGVVIIEWAGKIETSLPDQRLDIDFAEPDPDRPSRREIKLTAHGLRYVLMLESCQ